MRLDLPMHLSVFLVPLADLALLSQAPSLWILLAFCF